MTVRLNREARPNYLHTSILFPHRGTELYETYEERGHIYKSPLPGSAYRGSAIPPWEFFSRVFKIDRSYEDNRPT